MSVVDFAQLYKNETVHEAGSTHNDGTPKDQILISGSGTVELWAENRLTLMLNGTNPGPLQPGRWLRLSGVVLLKNEDPNRDATFWWRRIE